VLNHREKLFSILRMDKKKDSFFAQHTVILLVNITRFSSCIFKDRIILKEIKNLLMYLKIMCN